MSDPQREKLDQIAASYHLSKDVPDRHIEELGLEYALKWILETIGSSSAVLEMGYGDGVVTEGLLQEQHLVTVLEGSKNLCKELQNKYSVPNLRIVHALFEEYVPDKKFDVVVASHVLEHVDNPNVILTRIRDWLKPGGILIVIVPNRESLHRQLAVLMGLQERLDDLSARDLVVGHQRVYSLSQLREEVLASGFQIEEEKGFFLKVLPNSMMLNFSKPLLRALHDIEDQIPNNLLANIGIVGRRLD